METVKSEETGQLEDQQHAGVTGTADNNGMSFTFFRFFI